MHPLALVLQLVAQGLQLAEQPIDLLNRAAEHLLQQRPDIVGDRFAAGPDGSPKLPATGSAGCRRPSS
jgi:hypothetical protein